MVERGRYEASTGCECVLSECKLARRQVVAVHCRQPADNSGEDEKERQFVSVRRSAAE
jgi:hypothetical protein